VFRADTHYRPSHENTTAPTLTKTWHREQERWGESRSKMERQTKRERDRGVRLRCSSLWRSSKAHLVALPVHFLPSHGFPVVRWLSSVSVCLSLTHSFFFSSSSSLSLSVSHDFLHSFAHCAVC